MEILYSLGTVVKVKDKPAEYTIIGYCPMDESGRVYTYMGVNAALGLSVNTNALPFDAEDIEKVVFLGYSEEKSERVRINLGSLLPMDQGAEGGA